MSKSLRTTIVCVLVGLMASSGAGCGSSGSSSHAVAHVGKVAITTAQIDHWMHTLIGGDYFELSHGHIIPEGVVSLPPDYPRCESTLQATSDNAPVKTPLNREQLSRKCREIYQALKLQATHFLVNAAWLAEIDRDLGITASDQEVAKLFKEFKAREFPSAADQKRFFTEHRINMVDELTVLRLDVLKQKNGKLLGEENKAKVQNLLREEQKWNARTSCQLGYVVEHCKEYTKSPTQIAVAASVLMEQIAALARGRCTYPAACGKQ